MTNRALAKWTPVARALKRPLSRLPAPLHVMTSEAIGVARFCRRFWDSKLAREGKLVRPGLSMAERPGALERGIGQELLELQEALHAAHTEYRLKVQRSPDLVMPRARVVLRELRAVLAFMVRDRGERDDDERLANLNADYRGAASQDMVASALDTYATFAEMRREVIAGLGGFDAALIDEAPGLAKQLRNISADKLASVSDREAKEALELRNRMGTLLHRRMNQVRLAARFVFRNEPELVREVTSAYQRERRVAAKRALRKKVDGGEG